MTSKPRILLIDDLQDHLNVFGCLLETGDMEVTTALSAEEGLAKLKSEKVDCVVCDMFLPGMNGQEFISHVRTKKRWAGLPIIMISASIDDIDSKGHEAGADLFCEKRFAWKTLIRQVKTLVHH